MVIVDTSVWIPFFNQPDSEEKRALDFLIDTDEIALVGVVLAELLQGCRSQKEQREIKDTMLWLPYLEMTRGTWIKTGEISSGLLRRGMAIPLSDLILAALALENRCKVYTLDSHFEKIPGLVLYAPSLQ